MLRIFHKFIHIFLDEFSVWNMTQFSSLYLVTFIYPTDTEAGAPVAETTGPSGVDVAAAPDLIASRAFEQAPDLASFMLPWETPFMRTIFSDDDPTVLASLTPAIFRVPGGVPPVPGPPVPKPGKKPSNPLLNPESLAAHAIRPLRDEDDSSKEDRLLRQAVAKWALVLGRYCKELNLVA